MNKLSSGDFANLRHDQDRAGLNPGVLKQGSGSMLRVQHDRLFLHVRGDLLPTAFR